MKNIEINNKQKENLLEMCRILFPEYVIYPADNDGFIEGEQWVGDQNMGEDRPVNEFNIHWFEFCTNGIVNELAWRNIKTDILADCEYEDFRMKLITEIFRDKYITETFHIIDYLYEEFKKLK